MNRRHLSLVLPGFAPVVALDEWRALSHPCFGPVYSGRPMGSRLARWAALCSLAAAALAMEWAVLHSPADAPPTGPPRSGVVCAQPFESGDVGDVALASSDHCLRYQ